MKAPATPALPSPLRKVTGSMRIRRLAKASNATLNRVVTEITVGGWPWSGESATTKRDREGLRPLAKRYLRRQSAIANRVS